MFYFVTFKGGNVNRNLTTCFTSLHNFKSVSHLFKTLTHPEFSINAYTAIRLFMWMWCFVKVVSDGDDSDRILDTWKSISLHYITKYWKRTINIIISQFAASVQIVCATVHMDYREICFQRCAFLLYCNTVTLTNNINNTQKYQCYVFDCSVMLYLCSICFQCITVFIMKKFTWNNSPVVCLSFRSSVSQSWSESAGGKTNSGWWRLVWMSDSSAGQNHRWVS